MPSYRITASSVQVSPTKASVSFTVTFKADTGEEQSQAYELPLPITKEEALRRLTDATRVHERRIRAEAAAAALPTDIQKDVFVTVTMPEDS